MASTTSRGGGPGSNRANNALEQMVQLLQQLVSKADQRAGQFLNQNPRAMNAAVAGAAAWRYLGQPALGATLRGGARATFAAIENAPAAARFAGRVGRGAMGAAKFAGRDAMATAGGTAVAAANMSLMAARAASGSAEIWSDRTLTSGEKNMRLQNFLGQTVAGDIGSSLVGFFQNETGLTRAGRVDQSVRGSARGLIQKLSGIGVRLTKDEMTQIGQAFRGQQSGVETDVETFVGIYSPGSETARTKSGLNEVVDVTRTAGRNLSANTDKAVDAVYSKLHDAAEKWDMVADRLVAAFNKMGIGG